MEKVFATPMTGEGRARLAEAVNARVGEREATWFPFGQSILGTSLLCAKRGAGTPVLLFVGAHHGMEHITGNLLYAFLAERELPRGTYYVVPCLNPDGVELELTGALSPLLAERQLRMNGGSRDFSRWQANARGVDLNHNYPTGFDAYRSIECSLGITGGAPTRYSGEYPLSEPETQALMGLIEILNPDAVLTLHTQGREIFFGADPCRRARLWGQLLARRVGYRVGSPSGAAAYGGLTDTLAEREVPALTVECGYGTNPMPLSLLPSLWQEVSPLLYHAADCLEYVNKL